MTTQQIKQAVNNGKTVYWKSPIYKVIKDTNNEYLIKCDINNHCIGLTWMDGETLNGKEDEFFMAQKEIEQ